MSLVALSNRSHGPSAPAARLLLAARSSPRGLLARNFLISSGQERLSESTRYRAQSPCRTPGYIGFDQGAIGLCPERAVRLSFLCSPLFLLEALVGAPGRRVCKGRTRCDW